MTDKALDLIIQLHRRTSEGRIAWRVREAPAGMTAGTDSVVPLYLETTVRGNRYAIFEERYRQYDGDREVFYWTSELALAVLDLSGRVLWRINEPYTALDGLYTAARACVVNIDSLLSDLGDLGAEGL